LGREEFYVPVPCKRVPRSRKAFAIKGKNEEHDDRDIEFISMKRYINHFIREKLEFSVVGSCEMICKELAEFDDKIEHSLAELAVGYEHPEEKVFCAQGRIIAYNTVKHYPPSEGAIKYWLGNRRPGKWSNQQELALMGKHGGAIQVESRPKQICLDDFSGEELALLIAAGKKLNTVEEPVEEEE
jgi:hypothetical protein